MSVEFDVDTSSSMPPYAENTSTVPNSQTSLPVVKNQPTSQTGSTIPTIPLPTASLTSQTKASFTLKPTKLIATTTLTDSTTGTPKTYEYEVITDNLEFPEGGPICLSDNSTLLVEIKRGTLTRVYADGTKEVVAVLGGGPNSSAVGPDQLIYVTNNGGFTWTTRPSPNGPILYPGNQAENYKSGLIQRVDLKDGKVESLFNCGESLDGSSLVGLKGPNDLVFDKYGGFYFTDLGKRRERERDVTGVFYASKVSAHVPMAKRSRAKLSAKGKHPYLLGSGEWEVKEVIFPMEGANGIGMSIDGRKLYVAETFTGKLYEFNINKTKPQEVTGKKLLYRTEGEYRFDSLAVDGVGNIVVATLGVGKYGAGGLSVISKKGDLREFISFGDAMTTNVSFNGHGEAVVTLSGTGKLAKMKWPYKTRKPIFEDAFTRFKRRPEESFSHSKL